MILGNVTMTWTEPDGYWNPDRFTAPQDERVSATIPTETSAAFMDWGMRLIGQEISLEWGWMSAELFDALDALYLAGAPVTWYLEDPAAQVYTVEILSLEGELFETVGYEQPYRRNVVLKMLIVAEVVSS